MKKYQEKNTNQVPKVLSFWISRHHLAENAISDWKISEKLAILNPDTKMILKNMHLSPHTELGIGSVF